MILGRIIEIIIIFGIGKASQMPQNWVEKRKILMEILLLSNSLKIPTIAYRIGGTLKNREKHVRNEEHKRNKRQIGTKHKINYLLRIKHTIRCGKQPQNTRSTTNEYK